MKPLFKRLLKKTRAARSKMDNYQKSVTFAQAGEAAQGHDTPGEQAPEQPGLLLVIGNGSAFPRPMMDYALDMARRMSYEILALNVAPLPQETAQLFTPAQNQIAQFEETARENARSFHEEARQMGIAFRHAVKFGDTDAVIRKVEQEYGPVEFVVSEPAEEQPAERSENENRPEKRLCVYSMV